MIKRLKVWANFSQISQIILSWHSPHVLCGWIGQFFHGFNRTFTDAAVVAVVVVVVVVVVTIDAPLLLLLAPPRTTTLLNSALFDPLLLLLLNTLQLLLELLKKASICLFAKQLGYENHCEFPTTRYRLQYPVRSCVSKIPSVRRWFSWRVEFNTGDNCFRQFVIVQTEFKHDDAVLNTGNCEMGRGGGGGGREKWKIEKSGSFSHKSRKSQHAVQGYHFGHRSKRYKGKRLHTPVHVYMCFIIKKLFKV